MLEVSFNVLSPLQELHVAMVQLCSAIPKNQTTGQRFQKATGSPLPALMVPGDHFLASSVMCVGGGEGHGNVCARLD